MTWSKYTQSAERYLVAQQLVREKLLVMQAEAFLAGHERSEDGSNNGGSGTTEPDGHPED